MASSLRRLLAVALLALPALGCPSRPPVVALDLAARLPVADRWSVRDVLLFGTPAAEPHQAEGFYREAAPPAGDPFLWTKGEAEVSLTWPEVAPRAAVVDMAPYEKIRGQSAVVSLNGREVARLTLNDARHRYAIPLPAAVQRAGENRLRFAFASTASPAVAGGADRRQLAAALHALVVGRADDPGLDDLLRRDAPQPFARLVGGEAPAVQQVGPSVLRYALALPPGAELRFTPELHPAARAAAARALIKVTVQEDGGAERELWSRTLEPKDGAAEEVRVALPGGPGAVVQVGLHVAGERFAWVAWRAPRVMGRDTFGLAGGARPAGEDELGEPIRKALPRPNVLLIVLDAARARNFGCYGYRLPTTPEIDRIAGEGVLFERAYTPAVYTLGAMSSVWTSQYPDRHHGDVSFSARLPKDRLTLAELLGARGIHTAGFVANTVAGGLNGFERGFTEFHEVWKTHGSGAHVFREVLPPFLAANKDRPFFAYLHFREPHAPYDPEPPFDTKFGVEGPIAKSMRRTPGDKWITEVNQGRRTLSPEEADHLVSLYNGNLAYADQEVGAIRRALESAGLWDRTVVIVMADHGEALHEHGWIGHNVQLFEESVRVPLIVRFPPAAGVAGSRVAGLVDLLDVAPTIADLFGALDPVGATRDFQGWSLLPAIHGASGKPSVVSRTIWDRPRYAIIDGRMKLVFDTRTGQEALYDLRRDRAEKTDVRKGRPILAASYRQSLLDWIARVASRPVAEEAASGMSREQCESLKALGYLSAGTDCSKYP